MASIELRDKIFETEKQITITVDGLPICDLYLTETGLVIRAVETLDWEKEDHFYYEWAITAEQWEKAAVDKNKITIYFGDSSINMEVWLSIPVDLEEYNETGDSN